MLNVTLKRTDSIESILPAVELAMSTGDVCLIHNINYLGRIHTAALGLLARSGSLLDSVSGHVVQTKPGFRLLGIDEYGVSLALTV